MKAIENIGYRGVARFVSFALQAGTAVILARYLSARDYGIVGYALIFVTFLARFNDLGFGTALVQRQELNERIINVAFSLRLALGTAAFILALLASKLVGASFGDPAVSTVVVVLSLDFLISSLSFIPNSLMIRAMDYRRWIQPTIAAAVVRAVVACWLAIHGFGFWSIVVASVVSSIVQTAWFLGLSHTRVRPQWDKGTAGELLSFGLPLFSSGLLIFALFNADNLIIGAVSGAAILGYYAIAFNWGAMTSSLVYEVVHSVLFPNFARMQNDRDRMRRSYLRIMEQLSAIGVLIHIGLFCCAKEFLVIILGRGGEKWLPATTALQVLCIYGIVRLLLEPLGNVLVAVGRTSLLFRATLIATCCEILLLYPALALGGITGVAVIVTCSYAVQGVVYWPLLRDDLAITPNELGRVIFPSVVAGACAWLAGMSVESALPFGVPAFALMIVTITVVFVSVQGVLSSWRWFGEWKQLYLRFGQATVRVRTAAHLEEFRCKQE
jgi:lipopolysaccharide exporter